MELVVHVVSGAALEAALEAGVGGVTFPVPRRPEAGWWPEMESFQNAARRRGIRFYLSWDWLVREEARDQALEMLGAIARLGPDALLIRDMGLLPEARRRYPELTLHAAPGWGCHNSPGLKQAEDLGFRRVVLEAPVGLKDLALMRRQSSLPLEVVPPHHIRCFSSLCLLEDYLGISCDSGCGLLRHAHHATVIAALEMITGLSSLGVEAVQVGEIFSQGEPLRQIVRLYQEVWGAPPAARSKVLAAAREVLAALGERFQQNRETRFGEDPPASALPKGDSRRQQPGASPQGKPHFWLEARSYDEAAVLAREWREPLVLQLTPENYRAFLPAHRRWRPRHLVWRLPPIIREATLPFYRKALDTLRQAGYHRFVAGAWGAVALGRGVGGEVYGDQTLGVRNSWALAQARHLGVTKVCVPPGKVVKDGPELWPQAPLRRLWGYLHHIPTLAVWPREAAAAFPHLREVSREKLRWVIEGDLALLCMEEAQRLDPFPKWWRGMVDPLVAALPRSGLPWGRVPYLPGSGSERRRRHRP